jgi:hypothetical protein
MAMRDRTDHHEQPNKSLLFSPWGLVLLGFLIIVGALLFTEHQAHVLGFLVWLPLLACPLMHLFMHGGHGHGGHGASATPPNGERQ